jgi:hypothetical protein
VRRLLITGTRYGWHPDHLAQALAAGYHAIVTLHPQAAFDGVVLVHGDADGVDRQAAARWESEGLPTEAHPADWARYGKRAGPIRNQEMVDLGADLCIGFVHEKSIGTRDCLQRAEMKDIPIIRHDWGQGWML